MRSKRFGWVACLIVLGMLSGCSNKIGGTGVKGSGVVKTEPREVAGFSSISLETVGSVTVRQTGNETLTINAEDNILPLLESRVADGTLHLDTVNNVEIDPTKPIEFIVEVKSLEGLDVAGAGDIKATGIQGERLSISLTGVGNVTVVGSADTLDLNISGVGSYEGEEFTTKHATVLSSGVGNAVVNVSERLDADVSGVGSVEYVGAPQIEASVSGMGRVKER